MEVMTYRFPATKRIGNNAHVGVVGSGDLEVLVEPNSQPETEIIIRTGIRGFHNIWDAAIKQFFSEHDIAAIIKINDFGATPGVVKIRLFQALEVCNNG